MTDKSPAEVGRRIAIFLPSLRADGAVRMMLNIARGLAARGYLVEVLAACDAAEGSAAVVPAGIGSISLHAKKPVRAVPALVRYLRRKRPAVLMAVEHYSGLPALYALAIARTHNRLIIRQANNWSMDIARFKWRHRFLAPLLVSYWFRRAEIVAVSQGVADDFITNFPHLRNNLSLIYNPVVSEHLLAEARAPLDHPWFGPGEPSVVLGVGRLAHAKGFDILIDAFRRVVKKRPARLLILGEGPDRNALQARINAAGLQSVCELAGHQRNPYVFMARAGLFVLSSRFEGSPNVLIEALAVGARVVAVDCPSGPREILNGGKYGALVPTEDVGALADAILAGLMGASAQDPNLPAWLQRYSLEANVAKHVKLIEMALTSEPPQFRKAPLSCSGGGAP